MRVLYLLPTCPIPADTGNKHLTSNLLRALTPCVQADVALLTDPSEDTVLVEARMRAEFPALGALHLFSRPNPPSLPQRLLSTARLQHPALLRFRSPALSHWLRRYARRETYALVHVDMIHMSPYLLDCPSLPALLVASDAYSLAARRAAQASRSFPDRLLATFQGATLRSVERRLYPRFDIVCTVSPDDARYLSALVPRARMDCRRQHQPGCVHQQMPLGAIQFLGAIVAPDAAHPGRSDRLAVQDATTRLGISPLPAPLPVSQCSIHALPGAIQTPEAEGLVHRLTGRILPW